MPAAPVPDSGLLWRSDAGCVNASLSTAGVEEAADAPEDPVAAALAGTWPVESLSSRDRRSYESAARIAARDAREAERLDVARAAGCAPCEHAVLHGWWGELPHRCVTHCTACHRSWASKREVHCVVCCRHFASPRVADAHRRDGACVDPATAVDSLGRARFTARERPGGITWALAFYGERPAHWGNRSTDTAS